MPIQSKKFNDPIFVANIYFLYGETSAALKRYVEYRHPNFGKAIIRVDDVALGRMVYVPDIGKRFPTLYIWLPKWEGNDRSVRTLHHECFHATVAAMQWVGVRLADESEEIYAYYMDALCRDGAKFYDRQAKRERVNARTATAKRVRSGRAH
jgi:hypothetical protein